MTIPGSRGCHKKQREELFYSLYRYSYIDVHTWSIHTHTTYKLRKISLNNFAISTLIFQVQQTLYIYDCFTAFFSAVSIFVSRICVYIVWFRSRTEISKCRAMTTLLMGRIYWNFLKFNNYLVFCVRNWNF